MTASRPIGSGNGSTRTPAPAARAALIATSMSVTRKPVRSAPKGKGIGVLKPKSDTVPTGVCRSCEVVVLGVGVTVTTTCFVLRPPKVARKLATKPSTSAGATYTWVVSYCGPTATAREADAGGVALYARLAADINTAAVRRASEKRRCIYDSLINIQQSERRRLMGAVVDHVSRARQSGESHRRVPDARKKNFLPRIAPVVQAPSTDWP